MKKTIDLSAEALAIYDKWGHKKSEKVSQAIIEYESKEQGRVWTPEQQAELELLKNRVLELEKEVRK